MVTKIGQNSIILNKLALIWICEKDDDTVKLTENSNDDDVSFFQKGNLTLLTWPAPWFVPEPAWGSHFLFLDVCFGGDVLV